MNYTITLTEREANLLIAFIEDEQYSSGYEKYWMEEDRKAFDDIICKLKTSAVNIPVPSAKDQVLS